MSAKSLLELVREGEKFRLMRETFKRMTDLDLWLDAIDSDDPRSSDELVTDYYNCMLNDAKLKERCEVSHQSMRDAAHDKTVKYADGISGLIHFLVPIHDGEAEIGFLRCGGIRDSYRGVLKFMNFAQDLREDGYDEQTISRLEKAFNKLPKLHGENLAEAVYWISSRAAEIDEDIQNIKKEQADN